MILIAISLVVVCLLVLLGVTSNAWRVWVRSGNWEEIRLPGDQIHSITIDPANPQTIYINGSYKSTNGGDSWSEWSLYAHCLAIDPSDSQTIIIFTSDGICKTTNGGQSWRYIGGIRFPVNTLAIDPQDSQIVYAGTQEGVYKSKDGGYSWFPANVHFDEFERVEGEPPPEHCYEETAEYECFRVWDIAIHPTLTQTLYAATENGIYRSDDGGFLWTMAHTGSGYHCVAVDPNNPPTVYATSWSTGVIKSTDGGITWNEKNKGLGEGYLSHVENLVIDSINSNILYIKADWTIYKSVNAGDSWAPAFSLPPFVSARTFATDPTDPSTFYVGAESGVYKTIDGGRSWTAKNTGLDWLNVRDVKIDPFDPHTMYALTAGGVLKTTDEGRTWVDKNKGFEAAPNNDLVVDPTNPQTVYVVAGRDVYKTTNAGELWSEKSNGLHGMAGIHELAIALANSQILYLATVEGVYKSIDAGDSWVWKGRDSSSVVCVAVDPKNPQMVYASGRGVYKSINGGDSWTNAGLDGLYIESLITDPNRSDVIYATMVDLSGVAEFYPKEIIIQGIFKSTDGGTTWKHILKEKAGSLIIDPLDSQNLYAAAEESDSIAINLYRSADGGNTWEMIGPGKGNLMMHPTNPRILYGVGHHIFRLKLPPPAKE
jgi:photosystem II stability/assembly factor-like uncharacterized protein